MTEQEYRHSIGLNREMIQLKDSMYFGHLEVGLARFTEEMKMAKDEVSLRWLQGKVQLLSQLVAEITDSRDSLKKLEARPPQPEPKKY